MSRYKVFPTTRTIKKDIAEAKKLLQQMEIYKPMNPHMVLPTKEIIAKQLGWSEKEVAASKQDYIESVARQKAALA